MLEERDKWVGRKRQVGWRLNDYPETLNVALLGANKSNQMRLLKRARLLLPKKEVDKFIFA